MKIRDLIGVHQNEGAWADVKKAASDGWNKGGPIARADKAVRGSNLGKWAGGAADKLGKSWGNYKAPADLKGILPGQAMKKGEPKKPNKGKNKYDPKTGAKL